MKNKGLVIGISIIIVYAIIMLILFGGVKEQKNIDNNNDFIDSKDVINDSTNKYLIIDNSSNWSLNSNEWKKVTTNVIEATNKKFKVYANNNYLGENKLKYGKKWNIFNENNEYINYDGKLLAFSNDFDIKLIRFNAIELDDSDKEDIIEKFGNKDFDMLLSNEVINIDIDSNGILDKIICLSNNSDDFDKQDDFYNLVLINLNGSLHTLINENNKNSDSLTLSTYSINRVFIYDNNIYLILEEIIGIDSEEPISYNHLYKYDNTNFINVFND